MEGEFSSVSTPELVEQITTLAGHLNAANARFLALVAELDRRRGWAEWGVKSCAHWLNWKCGIDLGAAREKVRVAHALEKLPRIAAAMAEGRISYAKARDMTRVARCDERGLSPQHRALRNGESCRAGSAGLPPGAGCRGADSGSDPAARPVTLVPHRTGRITGDPGQAAGRGGCAVRESACRPPKTACRFRKTFPAGNVF